MDFPVDIWGVINDLMPPRDFAKICSTSRASYAARQPLVAAEVCYNTDDDKQELLRQLQLNGWPTCHSLCINLWEVEGVAELSQAQRDSIDAAGSIMPSLQCLHLIGRKRVPVMDGSIEGELVSLLAKHASVLTLQVETIMMPLELPKLQHLVLDIAYSAYGKGNLGRNHRTLFEAIKMLRGLKTLYIQSRGPRIYDHVDLTCCSHLQCVAVQGIAFHGGLHLPSGCSLHTNSVPEQNREVMREVAHILTGLTLCGDSTWDVAWWIREWSSLRNETLYLCKLKRLRLVSSYPRDIYNMPMVIGPWSMSSLEVLELDVHGNLLLYIHPSLALKRLVVITTGSLRFDKKILMQEDSSTPRLTELYLQSRAPIPPSDMAALLARYAIQPRAEVKLSDYVKDQQPQWIAQMPANFQPSNLRECCCGACLECVARGGVPILCDNAWTRDGFENHLKPHVRRSTQDIEHAFEQLRMGSLQGEGSVP